MFQNLQGWPLGQRCLFKGWTASYAFWYSVRGPIFQKLRGHFFFSTCSETDHTSFKACRRLRALSTIYYSTHCPLKSIMSAERQQMSDVLDARVDIHTISSIVGVLFTIRKLKAIAAIWSTRAALSSSTRAAHQF